MLAYAERTDIHHEEEVSIDAPLMCEARYSDGEICSNKADFVCQVSCCGARILLCEDCFFVFYRYCQRHEGKIYFCMVCDEKIILHTRHLTITSKV